MTWKDEAEEWKETGIEKKIENSNTRQSKKERE